MVHFFAKPDKFSGKNVDRRVSFFPMRNSNARLLLFRRTAAQRHLRAGQSVAPGVLSTIELEFQVRFLNDLNEMCDPFAGVIESFRNDLRPLILARDSELRRKTALPPNIDEMIAGFLRSTGFNVDARNRFPIIVFFLHFVVELARKDVVRFDYNRVLHKFCREYPAVDLAEKIHFVCEKGADPNHVDGPEDCQGNALLALVTNHDFLSRFIHKVPDVIDVLLKHGLNINFKDDDGFNIVNLVCLSIDNTSSMKLWVRIIQVLIEKGVDVTEEDNFGANALDNFLIDIKRIDEHTLKLVETLVNAGIELDYHDPEGMNELNPLFIDGSELCLRQVYELCKLLLELGLSSCKTGSRRSNNCLLHLFAVSRVTGQPTKRPRCCYGWQHETRREEECREAIYTEYCYKMTELFLEHGSDPNAMVQGLEILSPEYNETPLALFCRDYGGANLPEIVELMLESGADPTVAFLPARNQEANQRESEAYHSAPRTARERQRRASDTRAQGNVNASNVQCQQDSGPVRSPGPRDRHTRNLLQKERLLNPVARNASPGNEKRNLGLLDMLLMNKQQTERFDSVLGLLLKYGLMPLTEEHRSIIINHVLSECKFKNVISLINRWG